MPPLSPSKAGPSAARGATAPGLPGSEEAWRWARDKALAREEDPECPICFQALNLTGRGAGRAVLLLSCSHVFHKSCLLSFESFHVFEVHNCPVCRQKYDRRPWRTGGDGGGHCGCDGDE